jgi:hypothetical protein
MEQGRPEDAAAQVAAALTEVALRLGGAWRIEISEDGQLALVPDDDHA